MVALFRVTEVSPLIGGFPPEPVREAEPPQAVRVGEGGLARTILAGRLSVREVWVRTAAASLFLTGIVSTLVCPTQIVLGAKVLLKEGGWTALTCRVALAGVVLLTGIVPVGSVACSMAVGIVLT
jgi:hypothetical protein